MDELTFVFDGKEFQSQKAMFEYISQHEPVTPPKVMRTENEIMDTVLQKAFPNHTREIMSHLRREMGKKTEEIKVESTEMQEKISVFFDNFKEFLIEKNRRYGNSVGNSGTFYKGDNAEGILIRLDDKLSRIRNNSGQPRANDFQDLIGYIALYCCLKSEEDSVWIEPQRFLD